MNGLLDEVGLRHDPDLLEGVAAHGPRALDGGAEFLALVDQQHATSGLRGETGGCAPGGTRADDEEIEKFHAT